ncbi:exosome complex protein LRP1 [Cryptococcus gattii Ru294]|nr:exosome complex protein LRP1 [Cryptococcus gattii Ru294]
MTETSPKATLSALNESLDALEAALAPLEAKPWSQTVEDLLPLERTKIDVLGAYLINDLVWVYLKTKGVDPAKHDVTAELERIKTYYSKVSCAEGREEIRPKVDAAAAHRFVANSIPRAQHLPPTTSAELAANQRALRIAEEEEEESIRRLGKPSRFRHIQERGKLKLIPGQEVETIGDEDVMIGEDGQKEAEKFLREFANEVEGK